MLNKFLNFFKEFDAFFLKNKQLINNNKHNLQPPLICFFLIIIIFLVSLILNKIGFNNSFNPFYSILLLSSNIFIILSTKTFLIFFLMYTPFFIFFDTFCNYTYDFLLNLNYLNKFTNLNNELEFLDFNIYILENNVFFFKLEFLNFSFFSKTLVNSSNLPIFFYFFILFIITTFFSFLVLSYLGFYGVFLINLISIILF